MDRIYKEVALQGIPTIAVSMFGKLYVNDYLAEKGFSIFSITPDKVLDYAEKLIGKVWDVKNLLEKLEVELSRGV